jgi:heme A synthase
MTNKPAHEVKADNPGVTANQPKKTVWWRWVAAGLIGLLFAVAVVAAIASQVANFSPWGFILKLFKRG